MASKVIPKFLIIAGCILGVAVLYIAWQNLTKINPLTEQISASASAEVTKVAFEQFTTSGKSPSPTPKLEHSRFSSDALNQEPSDPDIVKAFKDTLTKHADPEKKDIAISLIDYGYLDMSVNLYMFYQRINLTNFLFVSSDNKACDALAKEVPNVPCVQYVFDTDAAKPSSFGSAAFVRKTHRKTKIVLDALKLNFNVLLVDVDIVFFKNPFPYLETCLDCDLQVQWDHGMACSGFYFVRATKAGIELMETSWQKTLHNKKGLNDQRALNKAMATMKSKDYYKQSILPEELFPNGFAYFHNNHIMFVTDGVYPPDVYMVHDNWIISEAAKIYRFKENLMWYNDRGGYYTDTRRKYLSFMNAALDVGEVHQLEMDALKSALALGHILNRTVILPSFSCKNCDTKKFKACTPKGSRCSLLSRYKVEVFDKAFSSSYREHVFLLHPLIPKKVLGSTSPMILIQTDLNQRYSTEVRDGKQEDILKVTPGNPGKGATVEEIQHWFSEYANVSIIRFETLYGAVNMNDFSKIYKGTADKIRSAFKNTNYLQR